MLRVALILLAFLFILTPRSCQGGESIDYQEYEINGVNVKAVIADLSDRHVKVRPVVAYGLPFSEQDFTYFLMRARPVAAINGTYFNMETCTPVGEISIDGKLIHYSRIGTVMAITKENRITFFPGRNFSTVKRKDFFTTLGGGPRLLKNGMSCAPFRGEGFRDPAIFGSAVRSAAGATKKGKLVLAVALSSVTLSQWASTLRALGVTDAINLDGGTSSGLSYRGIVFVAPGRKLSNILAVYYTP
jgi:exopolysaccharide biosynthesis protein